MRKALFLMGLAACSGSSEDGVQQARSALARQQMPSQANVPELGSDNRAFAFDLYKQAAAMSPATNLAVSPYSVSSALAMTYAGARGTTERELKATLHFTLEQAPLHEAFNATELDLASRGQGARGADGTPFRLNVNNAIWLQRDFSLVPAYLDTLALNYGAGVYQADFVSDSEGSRKAINGWVSDKTEALIPELLPAGSINADTRLVLTNTVYFNAGWKTVFEASATRDEPFMRDQGGPVNVGMMHQQQRYPYFESADLQAVAMPYQSDELSLIAILPAEGKLASVEAAMNAAWFDALLAGMSDEAVQLGFPKLDYRSHLSLVPALRALGMNAAFGDADFSGMSSGELQIGDVIHEAVVRVFEGGTIAAGATAVTIRTASIIVSTHQLTLNRPFLYAIYDQPTGSILFIGRVLDPTAN